MFDSVILVENVLMVYFARDTVMVAQFDDPSERESSYAGIHLRIACIIAAAYALGMAMKVEVFNVWILNNLIFAQNVSNFTDFTTLKTRIEPRKCH